MIAILIATQAQRNNPGRSATKAIYEFSIIELDLLCDIDLWLFTSFLYPGNASGTFLCSMGWNL